MAWKDINGWPYRISDSGEVMSTRSMKILKGVDHGHGYLFITLQLNGRKRQVTIHSLVAHYFIGPRPVGLTINHIDGNKQNNTASNLEYITHTENVRHNSKIGIAAFGARNGAHTYPHRRPRGETCGASKLTWEKVREIRKRFVPGYGNRVKLQREFMVSKTAIRLILANKTWKE